MCLRPLPPARRGEAGLHSAGRRRDPGTHRVPLSLQKYPFHTVVGGPAHPAAAGTGGGNGQDEEGGGGGVNQLVRYDAACKALAEAKSVDEVKSIRNKAEAIRAYARQAKNRDLEFDACEIRIRAERRLGGMIVAQKKTVGLARPAIGSKIIGSKRVPMKDTRPTLAEAGIDKKLSARAQKIASIPEDKFEGMMAERRKHFHEARRILMAVMKSGAA